MSNQKQSMGDLFLQQRRERASSSAPSSAGLTLLSSRSSAGAGGGNTSSRGNSGTGGNGKPKSFAEIQAEQMNESTSSLRTTSRNSNHRGGGPSSASRGGPRHFRTTNSRHQHQSQRDKLPREQGVIHTLLDKFGFIHCANRPIELFFHHTSILGTTHWDALNIGDEVEFTVGYGSGSGSSRSHGGGGGDGNNDDKIRAEHVKVLPEGSVVWEIEVEKDKVWEGRVMKSFNNLGRDRGGHSGGGGGGGIITVEGMDDEIMYTKDDCPSRLGKGDIVQFSLMTECRTGNKLARNITLIQSERERINLEREAKLLNDAMVEWGIVVKNKGDFGFIKSVSRMEEVYFHISHVEEEKNNDVSVKEGTEVEFYVIDESLLEGGAGGGGRKKSKSLCARKIKCLPPGSVKFEHVLATGVTGIVLECPMERNVDGFGRSSGGGGGKKSVMGKIRLEESLLSEENGEEIKEVLLQPDLYPGGFYAMNRVGSQMGSWIRPGDVLLFDVIESVRDGKCRALPTKHTQIASLRPKEWKPDDSTKPAIRLVELALMGRTDGIVCSIRDDYAFIRCAEHKNDAYMKLFEVFPNELQTDLALNSPELANMETNDPKGSRPQLKVGMHVSFDLSLQLLTNHTGRNRPSQVKESLQARRIQILPEGTVKEKMAVATGVKATIIREDKSQSFVGTIELEESVKVQVYNQRYPYIAKMLDYITAGRYGDEVVFNDVLSERDAKAVILMVDERDELEWRYVPLEGESAEDSHNRKLCISKKADEVVAEKEPVENPTDGDATLKEGTEGAEASQIEIVDIQTEEAPAKEKKSKCERVIKILRTSFTVLSNGSLGVGDIISCDLYLYRNSGQVQVENIDVTERKERGAQKDLIGYVTEVVPSRQFGFITGLDENGSKTGQFFFHFKAVRSGDDETPQDATPTKTKKHITSNVIRKGDEVKFDAEPGKNGKVTATTIQILPPGTLKLPSKVDKSSVCTGYILLEPSHTSLANTPSHMVVHSGPSIDGAGRWDNVGREPKASNISGSNIKEEGVILLLSDPSRLFSQNSQSERKSSLDNSETKENQENEASETPKLVSEDDTTRESLVFTHVRYKTSSLAHRFTTDNPDRPDGPRRGDLVLFGKTKGAKLVKDIRIEKLEAATTVKGVLADINIDENSATFISSDNETKYTISLAEVISCEKSLLKENQEVNGVLHDGKIFGVCRAKDIFLSSSLSKNSGSSNNGPRQRPKLNLTVKKELQGMGGQIMAQSKMAKGPDGTNGFTQGWTKRLSPNVKVFVPANIPDSGFDSSTHVEESAEE